MQNQPKKITRKNNDILMNLNVRHIIYKLIMILLLLSTLLSTILIIIFIKLTEKGKGKIYT